MISIGNGRKINPAYVVSTSWNVQHYVNTGPKRTFFIRMTDGHAYRVEDGDGVDAYEIERLIENHNTQSKKED